MVAVRAVLAARISPSDRKLLQLVDMWCEMVDVNRSTLGDLMLRQPRKFAAMDAGESMTVRNWDYCVAWLSRFWPHDQPWPEDLIRRPPPLDEDQLTPKALHTVKKSSETRWPNRGNWPKRRIAA